jgi:hypothetical protein
MGSLVGGHSLPYRDKPVAYAHFEQRKWFSYRPVQLFTAGPKSESGRRVRQQTGFSSFILKFERSYHET